MIPTLDSQGSSKMHYVVCRSDVTKRPGLLDKIHPLGKLVKADHSYRWEHFRYVVHQAGRWLVLGAGGEIVKISRCGQEYGDEG